MEQLAPYEAMLDEIFADVFGAERIAENGEMALEEIKQNLPDVVLLDVMMPGMNGFKVCKQLHNTPQSELVYIIMLTGLGTGEHLVQGLDMGADDYVTKPFDISELLARIRVGQRTYRKET